MRYLLIIFLTTFLSAGENQSLLKLNESPYKKYISELIIEKNMTEEHIKAILKSKQRTVNKNILYALDMQYNKLDFVEAIVYYEEVLKKVSNIVKNSTEAFYLADYLVIVNKYDKIKELLDLNFCESLLNDEKRDECLYYVYLGEETVRKEMILNKIKSDEIKGLLK